MVLAHETWFLEAAGGHDRALPTAQSPTQMLLAHETWFLEDGGGYDWSFLTEGTTLALLGAALLVTLALRLINSWRDGVDVGFLAAMAPYMPFAVRMHLAVSLVGLLSLGYYLSPAMDLQTDVAGIAVGAGVGGGGGGVG